MKTVSKSKRTAELHKLGQERHEQLAAATSAAPRIANPKAPMCFAAINRRLVDILHSEGHAAYCALRDLYTLIDDNSGRPSVVALFSAMEKAKAALQFPRKDL